MRGGVSGREREHLVSTMLWGGGDIRSRHKALTLHLFPFPNLISRWLFSQYSLSSIETAEGFKLALKIISVIASSSSFSSLLLPIQSFSRVGKGHKFLLSTIEASRLGGGTGMDGLGRQHREMSHPKREKGGKGGPKPREGSAAHSRRRDLFPSW